MAKNDWLIERLRNVVKVADMGNPNRTELAHDITSACDELERLSTEGARLASFLHARCMHPDFEYETTTGQRKAFDEDPPYENPESWERNTDKGRDGWERFEYHEEAYWRRPVSGKRDA